MKEGAIYPFRDQMVDAVLYSDTLRKLNKVELLEWLGKPDREQENHLYYTIRENRLGLWTLQLKSLVVKIDKEDSVEWIKLYE